MATSLLRLTALLLATFLLACSVGARAQSCPANIPHVTGTWEVLPYRISINPISANLMPNGKVLIVAGSENTNKNTDVGTFRAAVWDPTGTTASSVVTQRVNYDIFCSLVTQLPDGRSFVVGGTSTYAFTGESRSSFFDWQSGAFAQSQNMSVGRWYGTAVTLGDGRVVAVSGLDNAGNTTKKVEIYDLANSGLGWKALPDFPASPPLYPRMVLLPNGKLYYTGQGSGGSNAQSYLMDPATGNWTASTTITRDRSYGGAVLLPLMPPSYTPKVMNFGGGSPATASTEFIDPTATSPTWTAGPAMTRARNMMNVVLLPNGKVFAEGGSPSTDVSDAQAKSADLYDPVTNTMGSAGTSAFSRLYHSTTVLLPDARVAVLGSNPQTRGLWEPNIEIYTPPYLFDSNDQLITTNRPVITGLSFSGPIKYNTGFSVSYTSTNPITSAVLMRLGSSTHAYTMEQRMIGLCGPTPACPPSSGALSLTTPPNGNVAPPGYYMLFLLDNKGVPSQAQFIQIQLANYSPVPPKGTIANPANIPPISAGDTVNFSTSTTGTGMKYSWIFPGGTPAVSTVQNPGNVQFTSAGVYTASLTVIDSSGNSDPHPDTRTITVLPTTPDFTITASPATGEVTPGGLATYTINVTGQNGFTGAVGLTVSNESGFPTGVSGNFSPSTINGTGSSTLTMSTTTSTPPYAVTLTVAGKSGTLTHLASATLIINAAPPSISASPGNGQVSLSWPASVGASIYEIKRGIVGGGPYLTRACQSSLNYVDQGLTNGTPYYYVVGGAYTTNVNGGGEGANSAQVSATPTGSGGSTGAISGSPVLSAATVNLTTVGTSDWAKWPNYIHKASGGAQIPNFTKIGTPGVLTYNNDPRPITWTDGTPTATGTNDRSGTYIAGIGNGFQISAPADTTTRTLNVYVGGWNSGGRLVAHLSDNSAADYIHTAFSSAGQYDAVYTLTYTAGSAGQQLVVQWTQASGTGNVTLQGAALAGGSQGGSPSPPTGVSASDGTSPTSVTVTWNTSATATSYSVYRATSSGGQASLAGTTNTTSLTDTAVTPGVQYYYYVVATNAAGSSGPSLQDTGYAGTLPPDVPTNVAASDGTSPTSVTVTWTAPARATGYSVLRTTTSGGAGTPVGTSTTTSFTDSTVTPGVVYYYTVVATNAGGSSAPSAQDSGFASSGTAGGSLSGTGGTNAAAVNLTTTGTVDWAKWPNYIHKASGGAQITNFTKLGSGSVFTYANDPRPMTWTDGTPTATGTNDVSGNYIIGVGNGFQISVPADTTIRTLKVYVGGWNSGGKLVAHLSDSSAADYVNATLSSAGQYDAVFTLTYNAASAGQQLVIQWMQVSGTGNVTVQAVALAGSGGAPSGSLTGTSGLSTAAVNLTTTGTRDWAKWPNYIHKASGGSQIANFTKIGTAGLFTYNDDPRTMTWSDGTPTATGTNDASGNYTPGIGNGFQITAPADTTQRTLIVYVGGWSSSGKLVAHLSDGSAADFVDAQYSSPNTTYKPFYTLTYQAASAGQQLVVQWTQTAGTGNVTVQAAALQ